LCGFVRASVGSATRPLMRPGSTNCRRCGRSGRGTGLSPHGLGASPTGTSAETRLWVSGRTGRTNWQDELAKLQSFGYPLKLMPLPAPYPVPLTASTVINGGGRTIPLTASTVINGGGRTVPPTASTVIDGGGRTVPPTASTVINGGGRAIPPPRRPVKAGRSASRHGLQVTNRLPSSPRK